MRRLSCLIAGLLVVSFNLGCAASSSSGGGETQTAASVSASGDAPASESAAAPAAAADIDAACRAPISSFIRKSDGTLEILSKDGGLYSLDLNGTVAEEKKLGDSVQSYVLVPILDSIIHLHSDRMMLENLAGKELFKLDGDASKHQIFYNSDATELAIQVNDKKFNIWKTETGFGAIAANERVQDFVNRQMADHYLQFPGEVKAISIGKDGHVAIAMNDDAAGKVGLLYHMDSVGAPGKLQVLARTNSPVKSIVISPNADSVAAVDENGQLFAAGTDKKGFYGFSKDYGDVTGVVYSGSNPIIIQRDKVTQIDIASGQPKYAFDAGYDSCSVTDDVLYCIGEGVLDIRSANDGSLKKRYGFGKLDGSCVIEK